MECEDFHSLVGKTVEQIWAWGPIRLVLDLGSRAEPASYIDLDDALLAEPDGTETALDAFERPRETGVVLRLLGDRVAAAHHRDGVLHLAFASGCRVDAAPDEHYESWKVVVQQRVYQCLPGGAVGSR